MEFAFIRNSAKRRIVAVVVLCINNIHCEQEEEKQY
jgi:hypothetical protein